jgi:hypothetical protein
MKTLQDDLNNGKRHTQLLPWSDELYAQHYAMNLDSNDSQDKLISIR